MIEDNSSSQASYPTLNPEDSSSNSRNVSPLSTTDQPQNASAVNKTNSTELTWTPEQLLEIRARERTFDGAYWRTAIGLFGASLIILRVFGMEFFPVGLVFLVLGIGFLGIGLERRHRHITNDIHADRTYFVTSGGSVLVSGIMCISAYIVLLVLLLRIH